MSTKEKMRQALEAEVRHRVTLMDIELQYMADKCSVSEATRMAWVGHEEVGRTYIEWKMLRSDLAAALHEDNFVT